MIESLRDRVVEALTKESGATLSTNGPGGIQAGFFPCEALGLLLYFLVPSTSDILYNLESEKTVVTTTPCWQLEGEAEVIPLTDAPPALQLVHSPRADGCMLVIISCRRIHFNWGNGWGYRETIDCN